MLHVYFGEGKGKTTAALGLMVRAAGSGRRALLVQFLKGSNSGEIQVLMDIPGIQVLRNEKNLGFYKNMNQKDKEEAYGMHTANLRRALELVRERQVDLVILDEICAAYQYRLLDQNLVHEMLTEQEQGEWELVLTGRKPAELFLASADYITEMKKVRHPYDKGICARKGIEY